VVPRRRQPENPESRRQRHGSPGPLDRAKQASLVGGIGDPRELEREAGDPEQRQEESQDLGQHRHPLLQLGHAVAQGEATVIGVQRDDLPEAAADPARRRERGISNSEKSPGSPARMISSLMRWS
jgi:hypothetical protein